MKIARLAGLVFAAVMVIGLVAVSVASAEPLFIPSTGTLTALTGSTKLFTLGGADEVICKKSTSPGTIANPHLAVIVLHFLECTGKESGKATCKVHSPSAPEENLIITNTLHGVLGLILPHTPAILLLPISGTIFVTLAPEKGGVCIETTKVTGQIAGQIEPIGKPVTQGTIKFAEGVNQHFEPSLGGLVNAKLTAFSTTSFEEAEATIDYGQATEVT